MADVIFNGSGRAQARGHRLGRAGVRQQRRQDRRRLRHLQRGLAEAPGGRATAPPPISSTARAAAARTSPQLFLGTGLGSRSYAIIEQGMISRVIEAQAEDMRAFVEEAAGISRYKERRKETEARIADTRENLERLQDLRDEVDKQIRHLQRQAATARRYQALKEEERRLTAELLALRLREIDSGAEVHDSGVRDRDLAMQAALAEQRAAEAAIENAARRSRPRAASGCPPCRAATTSRRGDLAHRAVDRAHARAARAPAQRPGADARHAHRTRPVTSSATRRSSRGARASSPSSTPELEQRPAGRGARRRGAGGGRAGAAGLAAALGVHQPAIGAADQTAQVERARIEQLEDQLRRLSAQAQRLAVERDALTAPRRRTGSSSSSPSEEAAGARRAAPSSPRSARDRARAAAGAARGAAGGGARCWRRRACARERRARNSPRSRPCRRPRWAITPASRRVARARGPRHAAAPGGGSGVEAGWERAVETVLG